MSPRGTAASRAQRDLTGSRRLAFLVPALLVALVGAALTFAVVPPRYRATGTALLTAPKAQVGDNGITVNPYGDLGTATTRLATLVAAVGGGDAVHTAVTAAGGHSSYSVSADLRTPLLTISATGGSAADAVRTSDLVLADLGQRFAALQNGSGVPAAQQFTLHSVSTPASATTLVWRRILPSLVVLAALLLVGGGIAVGLMRRAARNPVAVLPRRPLRDRLPRREPAAIRRPVQLGGHAGVSSVAPAVGQRWEAPIDDTFAEGGRLPLLVPGEDEQQLDDLLDDALAEATAEAAVEPQRRYLTRPPTTRVPTPADTVVLEPVAAADPAPVVPATAPEAPAAAPVVPEPVATAPAVAETAPAPDVEAAPEPAPAKPTRTRSSRRVSAIGYEGRAEPLPAEVEFLAPADATPPPAEAPIAVEVAAQADPLGVEAEPAPAPAVAVHPLGGALLTVTAPREVVLPAEPVPAPEPAVALPADEPEPAPAPAEPAVVLPEPVPAPKVRALRGQQPQARHRSETSSTRTRRRSASSTTTAAAATTAAIDDKAPAPAPKPRASRAKSAQAQNGNGNGSTGTSSSTTGAATTEASPAASGASRSRRSDTAARDE